MMALVAGGCLTLLGCIAAAGASPQSPARTARPVPAIGVVRFGSSARTGIQHIHRYPYVILGKSEFEYIRRIKRMSPRTKVLGYEGAVELVDDCVPASWVCPGITYQQAQAHDRRHPDDRWILRGTSGRSLINPHYPHHHLADVGSSSYQRTWAARVIRAAAKGGFDGVMIDSILGSVSGWTGGSYPTAYPSDDAWELAMKRFVRAVGPALKKRNLYVLASAFRRGANDGSDDVAWWNTVAPSVNGLMAEYWEQSPIDLKPFDSNPCCWTGHWNAWLRLAAAAQSSGADFFPLQHGSSADTKTMSYGKASFLLVWNGRGGGYIFEPRNQADPWNRAWTIYVGRPIARRHRVGVGWRRDYTRGTVLVNPHPSAAQTFRLGRAYVSPDGRSAKSVTVLPVTGMILRRPVG
jgi:Hypothetical glycosyl hydrolase family 15